MARTALGRPPGAPRSRHRIAALTMVASAVWLTVLTATQLPDVFVDIDDPAIEYDTRATDDPIARLSQRVQDGSLRLAFDSDSGYLRSLLDALRIPVESQIAVFSKTSFQSPLINPKNPRAIYFNDSVAVAWPRGGLIEITAHDPRQGVIFYALEQRPVDKPAFVRPQTCLTCHYSYNTLNVPGLLARSVVTEGNGVVAPQLGNYTSDHRSPFGERWAGWYVSGDTGGIRHLGNAAVTDGRDPNTVVEPRATTVTSLGDLFNPSSYASPYSDVVALLVFDHQVRMTNLLTRIGWEARLAAAARSRDTAARLERAAREVVDYMLFVDEAPFDGRVTGASGFAERFSAAGPRDSKGRSLRQFDLTRRVFRYPCSYMIYSEAFDALPDDARAAIYRRLWQVLSGAEQDRKYARLSPADRTAILEILRDTKRGWPADVR